MPRKRRSPLIREYALKINDILTEYLHDLGIELIDFKLEFGKTGRTAPSCWQTKFRRTPAASGIATTGEKLDKDRFRRDLGGVEDAYHEILRRLLGE